MIWVNAYNMSEGICRAIKQFVDRDPHSKNWGDISVTEMCDSPLRRCIKIGRKEELVVDYSEYLWALLGSAVHYVIKLAETDKVLSEQVLIAPAGPYTLHGQADRIVTELSLIEDYKVTSVWSFIHRKQEESWKHQLNMYRVLAFHNGIITDRLQIHAILRDWSKPTAFKNADIPPIPFQDVLVKTEPIEDIKKYAYGRIQKHLEAQEGYRATGENAVRPCTDIERWYKVDQWAVMKEGNKRSTKNFDTQIEAEEALESEYAPKGSYHIELRGEENTRCMYYCECWQFCPYFKDFVPGGKPKLGDFR